MPDCTVTIAAKLPNGAAVANAKFTFQSKPLRIPRAMDGAVIVPATVSVTCNGDGLGSITLKPGTYIYTVMHAEGAFSGEVPVPDVGSTTLALLVATPVGSYELMSWTDFADLTQLSEPYASVTAGLAAVSDGTAYLALSEGTLAICRKVGGVVVPVYLDI